MKTLILTRAEERIVEAHIYACLATPLDGEAPMRALTATEAKAEAMAESEMTTVRVIFPSDGTVVSDFVPHAWHPFREVWIGSRVM